MRQIEAALEQYELFIAIGTSGTVYPVAGLVEIAKASGVEAHQFDINASQNSEVFNRCHGVLCTALSHHCCREQNS